MYFYHHYIQKGFTPDYLSSLPIYTKTLMMASLDIEIEKENKRLKIQEKLLKNSDGAMPVFPIQY